MQIIATFLVTATVLLWLVCSATMAALAFFGKKINHLVPSTVLFAGGLTMLLAAMFGWQINYLWDAPWPIYLAVAPLSSHLDALSSIFIGLLAVVVISVSLFSPGYLEHLSHKINNGCYWVELFLFIIGMLGLILAANAVTFLVFWELIALSSVLLVVSDLSNRQARVAAFIYLGATRIATGFLMAGFLWMHSLCQSWSFSDWHFDQHATLIPAVLIVIGLCIKAGIWPFHDWLPYAHPAAPAPVSALMSGVMIKVSLYALIRLLVMGGLVSPWVSYMMLAMGLISLFWGILWALVQKDLKSLLAYCSIENAGLILVCISLAIICHGINMPEIGALFLAAAIFHCVNHGLFKSLLFLGAGAIDCRAHTRDLELLGGLAGKLPWTMFFFVIGSAAICSLPPLNGFSSKWLIYQSLFMLANKFHSIWLSGLSMSCIAILGLVSGMSLYCFTKAIGIGFLGRPRSHAAEHATEVTLPMLAAQLLLALCCVALGISAPDWMAVMQPACTAAFSNAPVLSNVYTIPMALFAFLIAGTSAIIYVLWLSDQTNNVKKYVTWECGFGDLTKRMQATATGFAENVTYTFSPLFLYSARSKIAGRDRRHFPEDVTLQVSTTPVLASRIYMPIVRVVNWLGERMLLLQAGSIHLYLCYILLTLVALMVIGVLI